MSLFLVLLLFIVFSLSLLSFSIILISHMIELRRWHVMERWWGHVSTLMMRRWWHMMSKMWRWHKVMRRGTIVVKWWSMLEWMSKSWASSSSLRFTFLLCFLFIFIESNYYDLRGFIWASDFNKCMFVILRCFTTFTEVKVFTN